MASPNIKNKGGFEDDPDGTATKYKDCGQDQQMDESCEEGVRVRKGAWETGGTDSAELCRASVHRNHWEGDGSGGSGVKNTDALTPMCASPKIH